MPLNVRSFARQALIGCMAHAELGFNARVRELAQQYDSIQWEIDWSDEGSGSNNFRQIQMEPSEDPSDITFYRGQAEGLSAFLYTEGAVNGKLELGRKFSGPVEVVTDFYLRLGTSTPDHQRLMDRFEDLLDLVDEAALGALTETAITWPVDANYNNDYSSEKSRVVLLTDGAIQRLQVRAAIFIKRGVING